MNGKTVTFLSVKGGVGKTTLGVNTADMLARRVGGSERVLLIDLDAQASASVYVLGYDAQQRFEREGRTVFYLLEELLSKEIDVKEFAVKASVSGGEWSERLYVVPGDSRIVALEKKAVAYAAASGLGWIGTVKRAVDRFEEAGFSYIFIDPPATFGVLSTMALAACNYFVVPIVPDDFGRISFRIFMSDFFNNAIYEIVNSKVRTNLPLCGGVVFNKVRTETHQKIANEIEAEIASKKLYGKYPIPVYKTRLGEYILYTKALEEHKSLSRIGGSKEKAKKQFEDFFEEFYDYVIRGKAGNL